MYICTTSMQLLLLSLLMFLDTPPTVAVTSPAPVLVSVRSTQCVSRCPASAEERHQNKIVRIGVILPFSGLYPWRLQLVQPAIEYAKEEVYRRDDLLQNYTIEFDYRDSNCSETKAPLEAIDMYTTKSADVFLGPACDYSIAPIARFSYTWGIPIISAGALVNAFGQKNEYKLLTRVLGSYKHAGEFLMSVLKNFNYTNIGWLLHSHDDDAMGKSTCWFTLEAIFLVLRSGLTPDLNMKSVEVFDESDETVEFDKKLTDLSKKCRGETFPNP